MFDNQFVKSIPFPKPSHCTTVSCTAVVIAGGLSSTIINLADVDIELKHSSSTVKTTVKTFVVSESQVPRDGTPVPA